MIEGMAYKTLFRTSKHCFEYGEVRQVNHAVAGQVGRFTAGAHKAAEALLEEGEIVQIDITVIIHIAVTIIERNRHFDRIQTTFNNTLSISVVAGEP